MMPLTTKEVQKKLVEITDMQDPFLKECQADTRKGVQQLVERWFKNYEHEKLLQKQYYEMLSYERAAKQEGFEFIAGIDEVGRGPLAGPVVAAAVILKEDCYIPGLTDSKKLSESMRNHYYDLIKENAEAIGIGVISPDIIDKVNIYEATKLAMKKAIEELAIQPTYLLLDAMKLDLPIQQESIIKGDSKSVSIAASSVIAKVTRDKMMVDLSSKYPQYGFEQHMGYGTKFHLDALKEFGVTEHHRRSFAPVKELCNVL
ncbi:ribonuclease HII [Metabacillus litoralis]|uniref:ribonuclease HII n=1 Tax=Metabacillus litoralis TaxID=152268 RepID=UPI001BA2BEE6|nr:ribonuclease HII [Metabacillus litoralis]UHA62658.1 ribonuclease HII [Metabacillus litoralis]